jgi:periplasmic protein TonB
MAEQLTIKEFDEIVFENRNKEYGAYELRKRYNKHINTAFLIALAVFLLSVSIPAIMELINSAIDKVNMQQNVELNMLQEPPPLDEDEPPPPPPPPDPPPPVQETIKFTPPIVTEEPIKEEDIPPPQEEITNAGKTTQEGTEGVVDLPDEGTGNEIIEEAAPQIFTIVEQMPEFPGGEEKLFEYLQKNTKYPAMARESGISGTVFVTFVVQGSGEITDVKKMRGIGGGCDEEAIRVVRNMPSWKPGKQNGKTVPVQYNLPIKFTLR